MNPPRRPARASGGPQRVSTPQRAMRSRTSATPTLADQSTPLRATRGNIANTYGDDDARPIGSGVVEFNNVRSLAEQLQQQMEEKERQRVESREERARRESTRLGQASPEQQLLQSSSGLTSSPPNLRQPSRQSSRLESPFEDTTLPSGGIGNEERVFDDTHEGGLAEPMGYRRALSEVWEWIKTNGSDYMWGAAWAIPLLLVTIASLYYLPPIANATWTGLCYLAQHASQIRIPLPSLPHFNTDGTTTVTITASPGGHAPTASPSPVTLTKYALRPDASALDDQRKRIDGLETTMHKLVRRIAHAESANHLSPSLGAVIDPSYTSYTRPDGRSVWQRALATLAQDYVAPPPSIALAPGIQPAECWCAAPEDKGRLGIMVLLGAAVHPRALVYGHPAKANAVDIASAPRVLDVWVRTVAGTAEADVPREVADNAQGCESPAPVEKRLREGQVWICLGKMRYDVEDEENVQVKGLTGYEEKTSFAVDKVAVRVLENYGAEFTCLYHLKLEGERAEVKPRAEKKNFWRGWW